MNTLKEYGKEWVKAICKGFLTIALFMAVSFWVGIGFYFGVKVAYSYDMNWHHNPMIFTVINYDAEKIYENNK